ncbi:hypothetical protein PENANT_c019G04582 [Penicillium antarcticum]|uniref:Uncharacterized protein n=1 Tax=Penicillium antarcticum TaxID=416450 RepID=A0A1V6Q276_9EURO|nr:uncharacterized protein N7508_000993 [Penicillium antarcticum]KAJ5316485.1 hypothetical protein N7508_000993 [Penicillium antarcticum]OQD82816.1 hypothetical protein PENANT_c019G04582 [Penicillium antarcticum]
MWTEARGTAHTFASGLFVATQSDISRIFKDDFKDVDSIRTALQNSAELLKKATIIGLATSAINIAWELDSVFIVKVPNKVNGQEPSAMNLAILDKTARTCDKNGTCYFFIIAQNISNLSDQKWVGVRGLDKLSKYKITSLDFAQSATWFRDQFSGYITYPNSSAILKSLQGKKTRPFLGYFVNVPVLDFVKSSATNSNETYAATKKNASSEKIFLSALVHETNTVKGWPYYKISQ